MFSIENLLKKLIVEAIAEAYDQIKDGEIELAPADGKPEASEEAPAPSTRKRRTKAEIEAATKAELEAVVKAEPANDKKAPQITYDQLKELVLEYVLEHGQAATEKILGQFGVAKAQKLQPEQWSEAYDLFKHALADAADQDIA